MQTYIFLPERLVDAQIRADLLNNLLLKRVTQEQAIDIATIQLAKYWSNGDERAARHHFQQARNQLIEYVANFGYKIPETL